MTMLACVMGGNGRTLHSQLYIETTRSGPLRGCRQGTYHEIIPAVPWSFLSIFFGGGVVVFNLRDLWAWCPTNTTSFSALSNWEGRERAIPTTVTLPHLHKAHGSTGTAAAAGAWREAVEQLSAPRLPEQDPPAVFPTCLASCLSNSWPQFC